MNIHGLKEKKKKLRGELKIEEKKVNSSRIRVLVLRARIRAVGNEIIKRR